MLNPLFQMLQQFKKEIDNFLQLASEFNKVATRPKKSRLLRQIIRECIGRTRQETENR